MTWFRASLSHCRDREPPGPEELICHQGDIAVVTSDAVLTPMATQSMGNF